jgi:hypothetical protein
VHHPSHQDAEEATWIQLPAVEQSKHLSLSAEVESVGIIKLRYVLFIFNFAASFVWVRFVFKA